jgi:hypothetical protein
MFIVFMKIFLIVLSVLLVLFLVMSYSFNKSTERQKYKLIKKINKTEIRFYPKAIMASVKSSSESYMGNSSDNFRKLAGYIFGANQSSNKISMTAEAGAAPPLAQSARPGPTDDDDGVESSYARTVRAEKQDEDVLLDV